MTIQHGDIYLLDTHKLMCGDATNPDDVNKLINGEKINLVLTDPPYGIKIQRKNGCVGHEDERALPAWMAKNRKRKALNATRYKFFAGDDSSESARKNYEIVKDLTDKLIIWGGQYFADFLPVSGGWLFWYKRNSLPSFGDGELAWTSMGNRVKMYEHLWNGTLRAGTHKLNGKTRVHPTQKPVELHMKILQDFSQEWDVVLDCFGGSGTTLIACEQTGRKCLMMEISPEYCEIICERFTKLTGLQPVLMKEVI